MHDIPRFFVIVPAAGRGQRMRESVPKQYLPLAGSTVLEWSLVPFLEHPLIERIVVVLAADDRRWPALSVAGHARIATAVGGVERADSVRAGLMTIHGHATDDDWVLVHDAARPCLHPDDLARLLETLADDPVGGLLAVPVPDTLKRAGADQRVEATVPRAQLWRALTPQMFRYGVLRQALERSAAAGAMVTDESAAVEQLNLRPLLVAGRSDNLKITEPHDLAVAERCLQGRQPDAGLFHARTSA